MKINIWGSVLGNTGFDVHTRGISTALGEIIGEDLGLEAGKIPNMLEFLKLPESLRNAYKRNHNYESTVGIISPDWWQLKSADRLPSFHGFGIFEGTKIPLQWVKVCNSDFVTSVIVPSNHTKNAFLNSGVEKEISLVPHGVDEKIYNMKVKVPEELRDDKFNFLFVGGWKDGIYDRKGLEILLKAYSEEFKPNEKVRLNVKIHAVYGNMDYVGMIKKCTPPEDKRPQISIITAHLPEDMMAGLYRSADAFMMPSKAEAFCLPCAEAMACGVPIIAHEFGGQADYIGTKDGFLVPTEKMIPAFTKGASAGNQYIYENSEWGLPDIKSMKSHMRFLFDNPGESKKMGRNASRHILGEYKWSDSAMKLIKAVGYGKK